MWKGRGAASARGHVGCRIAEPGHRWLRNGSIQVTERIAWEGMASSPRSSMSIPPIEGAGEKAIRFVRAGGECRWDRQGRRWATLDAIDCVAPETLVER